MACTILWRWPMIPSRDQVVGGVCEEVRARRLLITCAKQHTWILLSRAAKQMSCDRPAQLVLCRSLLHRSDAQPGLQYLEMAIWFRGEGERYLSTGTGVLHRILLVVDKSMVNSSEQRLVNKSLNLNGSACFEKRHSPFPSPAHLPRLSRMGRASYMSNVNVVYKCMRCWQ